MNGPNDMTDDKVRILKDKIDQANEKDQNALLSELLRAYLSARPDDAYRRYL